MNRFRSVLLIALVFPAFACHHQAKVAETNSAPAPPTQSPDLVLSPSSSSFKFVAYGDIRFTESSRLTEYEISNQAARDAIVAAIAKEKPAFVTISGDIPWRGADEEDWKVYDRETKPLADAHITILPTVGNHEFQNRYTRLDRNAGLKNYYARFPDIPHRFANPWYSARYANCYFLFLDSQDPDGPESDQYKWLEKQLSSLSREIDFVFVVIHRPPYTAATDKIHLPRRSELAIASLLEQHQKANARPSILMLAGHVHNYERYQHGGVTYIVSGGGGAHPHPLHRRPDDLYKPADPLEPEYNYCVISIDREKLKFQMFRLNEKGAPGEVGHFAEADHFTLGLPSVSP